MLESIIDYVSLIPSYWILLFAFVLTFVENIFPPAPCDSFLVFTGSMIVLGDVNPYALWFSATVGSTIGFMLMYYLGFKFENSTSNKEKIFFIKRKDIEKVERWFRKYGLSIIVLNRFIAGTRAVISFVAGLSKMNLLLTTILSAISAGIWNLILIYLGYKTGDNWEIIIDYIKDYGSIVAPIVILVVAFLVFKNRFKSN